MALSIAQLEQERDALLHQLGTLGKFRRGTVSINYRTCGKASCWCTKEARRGHGSQYLWNATIGGKSYAKNLSTSDAIRRYQAETARYKEFVHLCKQYIAVNEQLCAVEALAEGASQAEAKKKLRRRSRRNSGAK